MKHASEARKRVARDKQARPSTGAADLARANYEQALRVGIELQEEVVELVERNTRINLELMKKTADAARTPVIAESQIKWMDLWTSSLKAVESNVAAAMQISTRAIDSCLDFVRRSAEVTQGRAPKRA